MKQKFNLTQIIAGIDAVNNFDDMECFVLATSAQISDKNAVKFFNLILNKLEALETELDEAQGQTKICAVVEKIAGNRPNKDDLWHLAAHYLEIHSNNTEKQEYWKKLRESALELDNQQDCGTQPFPTLECQ